MEEDPTSDGQTAPMQQDLKQPITLGLTPSHAKWDGNQELPHSEYRPCSTAEVISFRRNVVGLAAALAERSALPMGPAPKTSDCSTPDLRLSEDTAW